MEEMNLHRPVLAAGETILWQGKPKKSAYIADKSLALLPVAVIWFMLDFQMVSGSIKDGNWFLIGFMTLHLMPVWIWLGNVVTAGRRWRNTTYYVTNRRILIQSGFWAVNEQTLYFNDIRDVSLRYDLLDKLFGSGDVCFNTDMVMNNNRRNFGPRFENLEDPGQIYARVQRIVLDMQTDIEYPNAYRPAENPGYNTDYNP